MTAVKLRAARSTDAGKTGGILSEFIDETPWLARVHTRAEDIGFAGTMVDRGWVTVAEIEGYVSGFIACDGSVIQSLYVAAGARGQGIGSALLHHVQESHDVLALWTFVANEGARTFYERRGFVAVEYTDGAGNDEGLPDIRFEWKREAA